MELLTEKNKAQIRGPGKRSHLLGTRGIVVVRSLSWVRIFVTPWTAAHQAFLSFTISWSLLKPMSIELVMPSKGSHSLSSPSPPAISLSQQQGLFQGVSLQAA